MQVTKHRTPIDMKPRPLQNSTRIKKKKKRKKKEKKNRMPQFKPMRVVTYF